MEPTQCQIVVKEIADCHQDHALVMGHVGLRGLWRAARVPEQRRNPGPRTSRNVPGPPGRAGARDCAGTRRVRRAWPTYPSSTILPGARPGPISSPASGHRRHNTGSDYGHRTAHSRIRKLPGDAVLLAKTNLLPDRPFTALVEQATCRTVHDQSWHQILECRGAPG